MKFKSLGSWRLMWLIVFRLMVLPLIALIAIIWGGQKARSTPDRTEMALYSILENEIPRISSETR
jgi:hypothetical protein